jgi:sulfhydrogenase subunit beta (sulfur reductase)
MMKTLTIQGRNLRRWLSGVLKTGARLIAPVRENVLTFREVHDVEAIVIGGENPRLSPKKVLFPQAECLFSFDGARVKPAPPDDRPAILFGIRACDARALRALETVFLKGKTRDARFRSRLESLTLVGIACEETRPECFCESLGIDPLSGDGTDIFLRKTGEEFVVEVRTEKGEKLVETAKELFSAAGDRKPERKPGADRLPIEKIAEALQSSWEGEVWESLALQCAGCGLCTVLCPVCHCFDIDDEGGKRYRFWDSCMYSDFTLQASMENPRPGIRERIRQRFFHKFVYSLKNQGAVACVGCGRCIAHCPQGIDLREILEEVLSTREGA